MITPVYRYRVTILRVVDGDTLEADVDLGFYTRIRCKLRLRGINCPELSTPDGKLAKAFVQEAILKYGISLIADTIKADKYGGRWDAVVYLTDDLKLNDHLVANGYAKRV